VLSDLPAVVRFIAITLSLIITATLIVERHRQVQEGYRGHEWRTSHPERNEEAPDADQNG
jgi:hypothetical protein